MKTSAAPVCSLFALTSGAAHVVTGTLTLTSTGVIEQDDGSMLYVATFVQAGGTVTGTLQNQGNFIYQSGVFSGRLLNQGTVSLGLNFTAGNGVENDTSMTVAAGQTLIANGDGINNLGSFILTGGTVAGDGSFVNNNGGTLQGHGAINSGVDNFGAVTVNGVLAFNGGIVNDGLIQGSGTLFGALTNNADGTIDVAAGNSLAISTAWSSAGLIALEGSTARLSGGGITNTGAIQGVGLVGSAIDNHGTIEALGGTLSLSGVLQNEVDGLLTAGSGSKLLVTAGLMTNAGIINLTGGTFDNNSQPLNNTGEISGWGIFRTGGTGLDNNGSITFSGGTTTINGNVTNENGQTITVAQNPAIFTGNVINNGGGTFNTTNATATFAGGFTNNGNSNFSLVGNGLLKVNAAPSLGTSSSISVGNTTTLQFTAVSGSASVSTGVSVAVATGATLQLAGTVSALSQGNDAANITTHGAGTLLVTGTNQTVGTVAGDPSSDTNGATIYGGTTVVGSGGAAQLTATQILQNTLTIGAGSTVTILPSGPGGSEAVSTAVASNGSSSGAAAAASSDSSSDASGGESEPLAAIEAAVSSGSISSTMGQILEDRIVNDDRMAAEDSALNLALLDDRVMTELANIESDSPSGLAGTGSGTITLTGEPSGFSSGSGISFTAGPAAVPEPSSLLLAALGGIGAAVALSRARRRTALRASALNRPPP